LPATIWFSGNALGGSARTRSGHRQPVMDDVICYIYVLLPPWWQVAGR